MRSSSCRGPPGGYAEVALGLEPVGALDLGGAHAAGESAPTDLGGFRVGQLPRLRVTAHDSFDDNLVVGVGDVALLDRGRLRVGVDVVPSQRRDPAVAASHGPRVRRTATGWGDLH